MWEAHHNRGRLTSPNDVASDMKDRICRRSSRNVCTECDIVTFSKSRHFELAKPRKGLHYLWIHSTNLRPSGPEVLKDALAFICQKSGHGGAHVTRTNVLLGHCTLRASATLVGSVVRASPCCTTPGWRAFTACRHAWSSSFRERLVRLQDPTRTGGLRRFRQRSSTGLTVCVGPVPWCPNLHTGG